MGLLSYSGDFKFFIFIYALMLAYISIILAYISKAPDAWPETCSSIRPAPEPSPGL